MKPHERQNWIFDQFKGNAFEKIILLALHRFANQDDECWPSVATLAESCGIGTTTLRKNLKTLIAIGAVSFRNRPGKPKLYRLHCDSEVVTPTRTRRAPQHVRVDEHNKNIPGHASRPPNPNQGKRCSKCKTRKAAAPYGPMCWECADTSNVIPFKASAYPL